MTDISSLRHLSSPRVSPPCLSSMPSASKVKGPGLTQESAKGSWGIDIHSLWPGVASWKKGQLQGHLVMDRRWLSKEEGRKLAEDQTCCSKGQTQEEGYRRGTSPSA